MPCVTTDSTVENTECKAILNKLPKPELGSSFTLLVVEDIVIPHPYCITPTHLKYADSMYLNECAIERAEKRGAQCDICRKLVKAGKQDKVLTLADHQKSRTLFIQVENNEDLAKVKGLHEYLLKIKPLAESLGIQGFAFPNPSKHPR